MTEFSDLVLTIQTMFSHFVVTIHRQSYTADGVPANAEIEELVHGGIPKLL